VPGSNPRLRAATLEGYRNEKKKGREEGHISARSACLGRTRLKNNLTVKKAIRNTKARTQS